MTEHQQIEISAKEWLKSQGYSVYSSLKLGEFIADLIGIKSREDIVAIEVKPGDINEIRKGLGQAHTYLDYVHKVYLAIPQSFYVQGNRIVKNSKIGLLTQVSGNVIATWKPADYTRPSEENIINVLSQTTGFCWICGRTFNMIPENKDAIYMAHKDMDNHLFKSLEKALSITPQNKGIHVSLCIVCSKIMFHMSSELLKSLMTTENYVGFEVDAFAYGNLKKIFKKKFNS